MFQLLLPTYYIALDSQQVLGLESYIYPISQSYKKMMYSFSTYSMFHYLSDSCLIAYRCAENYAATKIWTSHLSNCVQAHTDRHNNQYPLSCYPFLSAHSNLQMKYILVMRYLVSLDG